MNEERLEVLKMLKEGKVTVEEAERLLEALEAEKERPAGRGRMLRVHITGYRGDAVSVTLPLALADIVLRFLPKGMRFTANGQEVDLARLLADIRDSGTVGKIVDITDHKGTRIEIAVE
jgi:hypothetical protein